MWLSLLNASCTMAGQLRVHWQPTNCYSEGNWNQLCKLLLPGTSNDTAALQQKLRQMEEEVVQLRILQLQSAKRTVTANASARMAPPVAPPDLRSVLVQNVHFSATPQIVAAHFSG